MASTIWAWLKAESRWERSQTRTKPADQRPRKPVRCTCPHTPKHHKKTGHCRPGCLCAAGANR